ncbi:hypothetical protein K435DRAFT_780887 [Dendrothele bispora CBS 962.96]|uniref:Uncharacterized protein n=1 Tax=Dendrothele bispora (strain CBS 962.96) TaxID=1314807 RepID=A0A4S8LQA8_DENBC|nr:hypothetical protein K435DRAFT_780887 [Dendrothele bispora CBS 962.96]
MCHRQLRFIRNSACGHLTYTGDTKVDCRARSCYLSSSHPPNCPHCTCKRYYTQPERIVTHETPSRCAQCSR